MAKSSVLVRAPFAYDADYVSDDSGLKCLDESLTVQDDKDECDINVLLQRFGVTGHMPVIDRLPSQGDFTGVTDYHSALNQLIDADATFMELPADIRKRFDHNAGNFVDFCSDPANLEELRKMGLARPVEAPPEPLAVRVIPDPAPK